MSKDEIVLIIDKSGSMQAIKDDAIGGFNSFLKEQRNIDRDANVIFVLFDDRYELVHNGKGPDIVEVKRAYQSSGLRYGGTTRRSWKNSTPTID